MRSGKLVILSAIVATVTPHQVRAQANEQSPHEVRNVISANPFLLIATWFNGEYERKVSLSSTLGLRVSTLSLDIDDSIDDDVDADYYSGRIFWRYYPRAAFRGFFFGLGAGLTSVEETGETHSALGAGFDLGYSWLLGRRDNFYISLGAGADRLFGGDLGGASAVIPTFRIVNIGFAF